MAEETPVETPAVEPVAPASVTPEQETPPDYVSKSEYQAALEAQEERIVSRLKQSTAGKVKAAVSSEVDGRLSEFDEGLKLLRPLMREDVSDEDLARVRERQYVQSLMTASSSTPEVEPDSPPQEEVLKPASLPPGREDEIQSILDATGVSGEEPELLEYADKNKGEPWWKVGEGFNTLAEQIAARSAGTPAGVVAPQGQVANPDLVKEYRTELDGLLYHRDGTGKITGDKRRNMNQLRQLQERYLELGLKAEDMEIGSTSKAVRFGDWAPPV